MICCSANTVHKTATVNGQIDSIEAAPQRLINIIQSLWESKQMVRETEGKTPHQRCIELQTGMW